MHSRRKQYIKDFKIKSEIKILKIVGELEKICSETVLCIISFCLLRIDKKCCAVNFTIILFYPDSPQFL